MRQIPIHAMFKEQFLEGKHRAWCQGSRAKWTTAIHTFIDVTFINKKMYSKRFTNSPKVFSW